LIGRLPVRHQQADLSVRVLFMKAQGFGTFASEVPDMETLIGFLNQLRDVLWGMYHNGIRPAIDRMVECSPKALVTTKLGELSRNRTHKHIGAETRKCLALFTEAAVASPAKASVL